MTIDWKKWLSDNGFNVTYPEEQNKQRELDLGGK